MRGLIPGLYALNYRIERHNVSNVKRDLTEFEILQLSRTTKICLILGVGLLLLFRLFGLLRLNRLEVLGQQPRQEHVIDHG